MSGRRPNGRRGVKLHRSYTVEEAARALRIAKVTVRRWIKAGLPAVTDRKPTLILGADLRDYLAQKRSPRRRCQPHECYCVKCREPRAPAGGMAEYVPLGNRSGNLRAICPDCGRLMHKRVSLGSLGSLRNTIDVSVAQADQRLMKCSNPSLIDHLRQEKHADA